MDDSMNFHAAVPKIPPRILLHRMPVRDLTFRIEELPERGFKVNASHFEESAAATRLTRQSESSASAAVPRSAGRWSMPARLSQVYFRQARAMKASDTKHIVHMPGLVTPISKHHDRPLGRAYIVTFAIRIVGGPFAQYR